MIIGNGDIAKVLKEKDKESLLFFVSGVSNSQEKRESEYQREIDLLLQQDKSKHVVYISSLSIFYSNTRYTQHKRYMEELIKENFKRYTIIRLGNITWGVNPKTIINSFRNRIKNNEPLEIWDVYRYIVNKEEFLHWIDLIPEWPCEMNIPGERLKVKDVIKKYVTN